MEAGVVFSCGHCSKVFEKRMDYNRHQKSHQRPHKCSICDRTFGLKTDRDKHRITHSAIRPKFMCTFPDCKFKGASHKKYLLKHMQTSHVDAKDPNSQKAIRLHYEKAPNATISQTEELYLQLLEAINHGIESDVKKLLSTNASVLVTRTNRLRGVNAGRLAVQKGNLNIVAMIIEAGVNASFTNLDPWLHEALENGHFTTASFLVASGARISGLQKVLSLKGALMRKNRDVVTVGDFAASSGDLGLMKILVYAIGVNVDSNSTDPWLHQALRNRHFAVAEFLIKSGANIDAQSAENKTAFQAAVLRGCEDSISLLHRSGAEILLDRRLRLQYWQLFPRLYPSSLTVSFKKGQVLNGDEYPNWDEARTCRYIRIWEHLITPIDTPLAEVLLDYADKIMRTKPCTAEALISFEPLASIHKVPRSCEEPATTVLSTIKCDDRWIIELLLEERMNPRGRYLWERVVYRNVFFCPEQPGGIVRFLREWGPIGTAAP